MICFVRVLLFAPFSKLFQLKALFSEYRAISSIAERLCGSTCQYTIQKLSVVLCYELLIYQHFSTKV